MKKLTVLVVDDNLVSRRLPSFILKPLDEQIQVVECESGSEALRMLEIHHVTHVLLDISMPILEGIQVAQMIRGTSVSSAIRLIAYTADAMMSDRRYLLNSGFDEVLLKPLERESLLDALGLTSC